MIMRKPTMRSILTLVAAMLMSLSAFGQQRTTFCNPLDLFAGHERAGRGGEPVVLLYQDDYYLFVTGRRGYWYSPDFQNWNYVDAPNFPGGVVSVVDIDGTLFACSMNNKRIFRCDNVKAGEWTLLEQQFDSDRYGDANMFYDNGHLYMHYGWSQLMAFEVVELDKETFKEISEPKVLFFSDYKKHGFETRRHDDVIYSIFGGRRDYFEEEYPWIEGPWMTKHNGKYYLQYAAIGLEFLSYSHGVYVSDSPTGPFVYSQHNPLTFKTTGFAVGAGHGSTFHDKNGHLWTICMIPASYGGGGRGSELAIYPTDVDADGVMYSNVSFGDYPQYYPASRKDGVDNYTGWKLLSHKKKVTVSSTFEDNKPEYGVDEKFMTNWVAETGDPGEFFQVDLGKVSDIYAIQCNFDHIGGQTVAQPRGAAAAQQLPEHYQCFIVETSIDGTNWTVALDKSDNKYDLHHDYNEFKTPVQGRYVRVTNAAQCHDGAKFCMKDLRIFGNPYSAASVKVGDVKVVRNPEDLREASLLWNPVPGADGYIIRYGIEPDKLYNSYILYDGNYINIHSLNTESEYFFEVESFDSGLDYYREVSEQVNGTGGEIELNSGRGSFAYSAGNQTQRFMVKEGVDEYVFENITPGNWTLNHTFGPVLWAAELTEADLIGEGEPGITAKLTEMGVGTEVTGEMVLKVVRGKEAGKIIVNILHNNRRGGWPMMGGGGGGMGGAQVSSPVVNPDNTVTFNYRNPSAQKVQVNAQFASGPQDMTKDANGVWSVTLGPVAPDMYPYSFVVDGVQIMDPLNADWFPNETFKNSIVDVRGQGEPLIHALKNVPHGAVDYVNYWSESLGTYGNAIVYTPPTYYKNKNKKYPVFYLISGTTDTEEVYYKVGRMNLILDNLLAEGAAKEMIIVLPYGNPSKYFPAGKAPRVGDMFTKDLINDLMPYVEKNYRTINDRDHRAIGGFSRGGNQGLAAGLTNLDKFSWLCSYSSFTSTTLPNVYDDPQLNDKIHLFWLGVGTDDFLYGNAKEYMDFLDSKGIKNVKEFTTDKFGHTWMNAKYFLDKSMRLLFQD